MLAGILHIAVCERDALNRAHSSIGIEQQLHFLVERDCERILPAWECDRSHDVPQAVKGSQVRLLPVRWHAQSGSLAWQLVQLRHRPDGAAGKAPGADRNDTYIEAAAGSA